jgi:hypothetical protein
MFGSGGPPGDARKVGGKLGGGTGEGIGLGGGHVVTGSRVASRVASSCVELGGGHAARILSTWARIWRHEARTAQ